MSVTSPLLNEGVGHTNVSLSVSQIGSPAFVELPFVAGPFSLPSHIVEPICFRWHFQTIIDIVVSVLSTGAKRDGSGSNRAPGFSHPESAIALFQSASRLRRGDGVLLQCKYKEASSCKTKSCDENQE
jgi:hypothetical protein